MAVGLGLLTNCIGEQPAKDILDDPPALEAAAKEMQGQFQNDRQIVKFEKPKSFNPGAGRSEVLQATLLAAGVRSSELDLFSQQGSQTWKSTTEFFCSVFGYWEKFANIKLPPYEDFVAYWQAEFVSRTLFPSDTYRKALADLFTALVKVHADPLGLALTAVVHICEID